jgi:hypothetical protein
MYYRARYTHAECARFISEDPIGWASGQTNNYAYVGGDPVSFTDPSGLRTILITTYDYGIGSHSALCIQTPGEPPFIYDPAGSYVPPSGQPRGSGDFFESADASLGALIQHYKKNSDSVVVTEIPTTLEQERQIKQHAINIGGKQPFFCAVGVSQALGGVCGIKPSALPGKLANNAKGAQCTPK